MKSESVCVADMVEIEVVSFSCGSGQLTEKQDYPVEEGARLLDGHSRRTPIWFLPTKTKKGNKHVNNSIVFKVISIVLFKGTYYTL